jgi:hypothetical protein
VPKTSEQCHSSCVCRTARRIRSATAASPAFTVRIVTDKGLAAMAAFDELRVAEAYMDGDLDIEGDLLTALKLRPVAREKG